MYSSCSCVTLATLTLVILALAAPPADAQQGPRARHAAKPCRITFDRGFQTRGGAEPVEQRGVERVPGRRGGQAARFGRGALLTYPAAGHYDPRRGGVSMWVRPDWDSAEAQGDKFFWGVAGEPGKENRTVLGFNGRSTGGVIYFGGDGAVVGLAAPVNWKKGEWHHVAVWWDADAACRALYIDGVRRHAIMAPEALPENQDVVYIGALPCTTRWLGVPDGHEAEAALDEVCLYTTVEAPDYDAVRRAAAEDLKARKAFEAAREAARPAYEAAFNRLRETFTLNGVAADHREAGWDDLVGMAAPMTLRVPIQTRRHPDTVYAHPDLSLSLGIENESLGLGFALGAPFRLPDMYRVRRGLHKGYQPIVSSVWETAGCTVTQTALALLPRDTETVTGREPQYLAVRMAVANTGPARATVPLLVLVGQTGGGQNTNYAPFLGSASRWMAPDLGLTLDGRTVRQGDRVLLAYQTGSDVSVALHAKYRTGVEDGPVPAEITNCLAFGLEIDPGQTATVDLVTSGSSALAPAEEQEAMAGLAFDDALARAEAYWDRSLEPGMKLTTPEPRLNDIYKALILSCLANYPRNPDRPWCEPNQFPSWRGVWPWEWVHMAVPLCAVGFARELEPTYRFFVERQTGRGPYEEPGRGPEGDIHCTYGCYTGNFLLRWMSETGTVLWAFAARYRYTGDAAWLEQNRDSILAAWDWIQGERARTRRYTPEGEKVRGYGLLPRGRVHDWNEWHQYFTFTDNYTWKGMDETARAFEEAGLPDAPRLRAEADDYRQCILDAVARVQFIDPETGLLFVPNLLEYQEGARGGVWWADGPSALFATNMLDPRTDERFGPMVAYLQRKWGTLAGLLNRMDEPAELGDRNPFWYVNSTERAYFMNYLARGETEKALLIFYSTLVYGMSHDCYQTVERIHVSDANYAPFQPNASGNGRILEMMRRMVIDEQEPGVLWLLRGCPRRWFAAGQSVHVADAPTLYGPMALSTQSDGRTLRADIQAPPGPALRELRVLFRHPDRRPPVSATVNGAPARLDGDAVVIPAPGAGAPSGVLHVVAAY